MDLVKEWSLPTEKNTPILGLGKEVLERRETWMNEMKAVIYIIYDISHNYDTRETGELATGDRRSRSNRPRPRNSPIKLVDPKSGRPPSHIWYSWNPSFLLVRAQLPMPSSPEGCGQRGDSGCRPWKENKQEQEETNVSIFWVLFWLLFSCSRSDILFICL